MRVEALPNAVNFIDCGAGRLAHGPGGFDLTFVDYEDGREKTLNVTTAVRLNDRLGRGYFCFIKPFHRMIVPAVVKRSLHRLESEVRAGSADR